MAGKGVMIDVDGVTIRFNLSNQKVDNLKEYVPYKIDEAFSYHS